MLSSFRKQKLSYLFNILDFDHDGVLQKSDLNGIAENVSIFRCFSPGSEIELFVAKTALNIWNWISSRMKEGDLSGYSLDDWLDMWETISTRMLQSRMDLLIEKAVDDLFYVFDKNHDNYLQKQEYLTLVVSLRVSIKAADFCFKTLDRNGDMRISRDELTAAISEFFLSDVTSSPGNFIFGNPEISKFSTRSQMTF